MEKIASNIHSQSNNKHLFYWLQIIFLVLTIGFSSFWGGVVSIIFSLFVIFIVAQVGFGWILFIGNIFKIDINLNIFPFSIILGYIHIALSTKIFNGNIVVWLPKI